MRAMTRTAAVGLTISTLLLSGCSTTKTYLMYNPETKEVKEFKRDPLKNWEWEQSRLVADFQRQYRKLGFIPIDNRHELPAESSQTRGTLSDKLSQLKSAHEQGLLTDPEYQTQRDRVMERFQKTPE